MKKRWPIVAMIVSIIFIMVAVLSLWFHQVAVNGSELSPEAVLEFLQLAVKREILGLGR